MLKSPVGKKYRFTIGLWKQIFITFPIAFLEWNNKAKLVPVFLENFMKKLIKV